MEQEKTKSWEQRQAEIEESSERVGKPGESEFADSYWMFLPMITGCGQEEQTYDNPNFSLKNIAGEYEKHDFILTEQSGREHLIEVKTRHQDKHFDNVVVELEQKDDRGPGYIPGWYHQSKAQWFVFIHWSSDPSVHALTCISAANLRRCVDAGGHRKTIMGGDKCLLIPCKTVVEYGGKTIVKKSVYEKRGISIPGSFENTEDGKCIFHPEEVWPFYADRGIV